MKIETLAISSITPYPNNPRKNAGAVDAVAESIRQCGYCAPIVVDENMVILAGHTRLMAVKKLGWDSVEVCIKEGMTDIQKRMYRLLDNKTSEIAGWDFDMLTEELDGLDFDGFDFGFGIDGEEEVVEDEPPELPETPITQLGDVWLLGRHRMVCGDSTKADTFTALMDGKMANLVVTDPPYNVNYEGTAGKIKNDNMGNEAFYDFLLAAFTNTEAAMAQDASIYVFHADTEGLNFRKAFSDAGFQLSGCCIWKKPSLVLGRSPYQWQHEPVLFGWKKKGKHNWYTDRKQTTIWEFDKPRKNADHPTMKPVALLAYPIMNSSLTNCIVLDPFGGSGSTLIACEQSGRICYTIELDEKYCDVIVKRYIGQAGGADEVSLIRDGVKYAYSDVAENTENS